jgi:hypothetical protein
MAYTLPAAARNWDAPFPVSPSGGKPGRAGSPHADGTLRGQQKALARIVRRLPQQEGCRPLVHPLRARYAVLGNLGDNRDVKTHASAKIGRCWENRLHKLLDTAAQTGRAECFDFPFDVIFDAANSSVAPSIERYGANVPTMICANRLTSAVLFSIGCAGLPAAAPLAPFWAPGVSGALPNPRTPTLQGPSGSNPQLRPKTRSQKPS